MLGDPLILGGCFAGEKTFICYVFIMISVVIKGIILNKAYMNSKPIQTANNPKILVVEDEGPIRMGITAAIRRKGYNVITAENGNDALIKAGEDKPDLIISDVMMPVLDGFEMKKKLNEDPELAAIPIIYLTARTSVEDRVRGFDGGADDYVAKPFVIEELTARIDAVLRRVHWGAKYGEEKTTEDARLRRLETLRNELLQNFHHELRTPLNNVMLFMEIVASHKFEDPEEQKVFLKNAQSNSERLESVIADMILLSDLDNGQANSIRQTIDTELHIINPIKRRLVRYEKKGLKFLPIVSVSGTIKAPRNEFTRAVLHLLDNAFKFSGEGGTVVLNVASGKNGGATITVEDHGPGVAAALREKVFERYYQISQGVSRENEGLGVGLTLARAVFRNLGGDVAIIESAEGCCVQAVLPDVSPDDIVYG